MKLFAKLLFLIPVKLFSQSVTVTDLMKFLNQPERASRNFLVTHSFSSPTSHIVRNDTLITFSNTVEYITFGSKWKSSDGQLHEQVSYATKDSMLVAKLANEVKKLGFGNESSSFNAAMNGNITFLENDTYIVQIIFTQNKRGLNSISFIKKS